MDITTITSFRTARTRADLALRPGEAVMAGGTWLMSEPQPETTGFVDLTGMGWPAIEPGADGLRIAATCTIAELVAYARGEGAPAPDPSWRALTAVPDAAAALLASFKIWQTATVGGNVCRAFAAGAILGLLTALDGEAEIWCPDGTDRVAPVQHLAGGNGVCTLAPGEVLRAVTIPASALRARLSLQKIALAELGRSGSLVFGRVDDDGASVFTVTAATEVPVVLRFDALPTADELADAVAGAPRYYTDPLGAADWRRGVSVVLAERIRQGFADAPHPIDRGAAA